jgi:hypothetical protein
MEVRMKARTLVAALIVAGGAFPIAGQPASPAPAVIQRSGFIFKGTIQKLASSNVSSLPENASTIIVRVDEILKAPPALASYRGRDVTVQLVQRGSRFRQGQQAVFYTTSLLYGENLAVKEVTTVTAQADVRGLASQIAQSERQAAEQALAARLVSSALVITGRVADVAAFTSREASARRSEHDPELWRAEVEVIAVLKGQRPGNSRVPVYFAHSTDERWILSPKYTPGQEGIFLLHTEEMARIAQPGYSTLDRLDFQPTSQLDVVRRLLTTRR